MHYCHGRAQVIECGHCIFKRPERSQLSVTITYPDFRKLFIINVGTHPGASAATRFGTAGGRTHRGASLQDDVCQRFNIVE